MSGTGNDLTYDVIVVGAGPAGENVAAQAEQAGYRTRVVDYDLGSVSGAALHADGYTGRARMVIDEDRQVILGMTFAGPDVAELLHAATIAIAGEVPLKRLWHAVPAFPTISEAWPRLLEGYGRPGSWLQEGGKPVSSANGRPGLPPVLASRQRRE
jgi:pyruvate/2-oxoglutarate dehydrogenase complex dihydrolipoamide dehydrogenase (E3) component